MKPHSIKLKPYFSPKDNVILLRDLQKTQIDISKCANSAWGSGSGLICLEESRLFSLALDENKNITTLREFEKEKKNERLKRANKRQTHFIISYCIK